MESQGPATRLSTAWLAAFQRRTFSRLPFANAFEFFGKQHGSRKLSSSSCRLRRERAHGVPSWTAAAVRRKTSHGALAHLYFRQRGLHA